MERKSIIIDIPDGMCIDESKSTFEKIVFKKVYIKPRSWQEYCVNTKSGGLWYIEGANSRITRTPFSSECLLVDKDKNTLPTEEMAKKFLAYMQLMSLRYAWIGDWEPSLGNDAKYCIEVFSKNKYRIRPFYSSILPLSFPTKEMAQEFLSCFKDLLEQAEGLY